MTSFLERVASFEIGVGVRGVRSRLLVGIMGHRGVTVGVMSVVRAVVKLV